MATNPASQYATDRNLRARQRLWEQQDPAFDVVGWTLHLAGVTSGLRVLDVGCGNGRYLTAMTALGVNALGCDLSVGMLKAGPREGVVAADAVRLPFPASQFDVVLAPHMLYHVADRAAAAREFRRVITRRGRCVVVANGAGHLGALRAVVEDVAALFQPGWKWIDRLAEVFSLENGAEQLSVAFDNIRCVRPAEPGRAVITDPEVAASYVASVGDIYGQEVTPSWDRLVESVRTKVAEIIDREGAFVVEGDVGAFLCQ